MTKPVLNVALKAAMFASGKHQQQIAKLARISPQTLSHVIHGRREFTGAERKRIAKALSKAESELFAEPTNNEAVSA